MIGFLGGIAIFVARWYFKLSQKALWLAFVGLWLFLLVVSSPQISPKALHHIGNPGFWFWAIFGPVLALVVLYAKGIAALRKRAAQNAAVTPIAQDPKTQGSGAAPIFAPAEVERYTRHIMLREIGGAGQQKLKRAKVLVIGAGGLGAPVLLYLAGAGIGTIGVIDDDEVDASNLQRQVIHKDENLGQAKVFSAAAAMKALNPFVEVRPYKRRLTAENAADLIAEYDLILDGCDNFQTRQLVNEICVLQGKPLISGAISQWEGQLSLFHPKKGGPCYTCVFPTEPAAGLAPNCAAAGVAAPLPGVIGTMMACEAVKYLTGAGQSLHGRLLIWDALYADSRMMRIKKDEACPICAKAPEPPL